MPDLDHSSLPVGLYLVATPIGNARDITLRALDVLREADVLAAEDTRVLRKLLAIHGVPLGERRVVAYHDHSSEGARRGLLDAVDEGKSVAYTSDAGMPLIADPGYALVRDAVDRGITVTSVPGASASLAALSLSGLPTDRFLFAGFVPAAKGARTRFFEELSDIPATLVIFDTPRRVLPNLKESAPILGADRRFTLCRELTKRFEDVRRGVLGAAADVLSDMPEKGECVVVIEKGANEATQVDLDEALTAALETMTVKDAAAKVAADLGIARRDAYQRALSMERDP